MRDAFQPFLLISGRTILRFREIRGEKERERQNEARVMVTEGGMESSFLLKVRPRYTPGGHGRRSVLAPSLRGSLSATKNGPSAMFTFHCCEKKEKEEEEEEGNITLSSERREKMDDTIRNGHFSIA